MLKIRLARYGKKNNPFYRIVVAESRQKREGRALDLVGFWDPKNNNIKIDNKKLESWKLKGAQETEAVRKLITQK